MNQNNRVIVLHFLFYSIFINMKLKHLFFWLLFISTSLSLYSQSGITIVDSILSGNIQRKFRLYKPTSYTGNVAVPLVFNLHGYTSNAIQQQFYGNFMPIADTANFLIVHPDGTGPSNAQFWNAGFGASPNDVAFLNDLIDSLKLQYNIDLNCVYTCGMSNGGIMSYYMAATSNFKFAAIASVTGTMFNSWLNVTPGRIVPVMEIHGTADATVPYIGSAANNMAPIDTVLKRWRMHNSCNSSSVVTNVPNINTTDGATAINYKFYNSNGKAYVEHYKVIGGAHTWPGAAFNVGVTCQDFNASLVIWKFFRQFKLNQFITTSVADIKNNSSTINLYPNPANDKLNVTSESKILSLQVLSMDGRILQTNTLSNTIDIHALANGIYILSVNTEKGNPTRKFIKE
jgi:polyhydroxybutyrate depolymerase